MSETAGAALWELPAIDGPVVARRRRASDLDAIEREAWDAGFAEGREAGMLAVEKEQQAARRDLERMQQQMRALLDYMARPLAQLDEQVQRQLAQLAGAIARQVVRRELKTKPDEIIAVIRATVSLLPLSVRDIRVHLHPDDARLVRERLPEGSSERVWSVIEDPTLTRGGCRVSSENSSIDAQVEQRLGAAIATVLGDERHAASDEATP
jgi:flagellar assembly protein FliH